MTMSQAKRNISLADDADVKWKVGTQENEVKLDDLLQLVSMHHVTMGSWQPQLRLRRPFSINQLPAPAQSDEILSAHPTPVAEHTHIPSPSTQLHGQLDVAIDASSPTTPPLVVVINPTPHPTPPTTPVLGPAFGEWLQSAAT
jgi:hypothetical protein